MRRWLAPTLMFLGLIAGISEAIRWHDTHYNTNTGWTSFLSTTASGALQAPPITAFPHVSWWPSAFVLPLFGIVAGLAVAVLIEQAVRRAERRSAAD